MTNTIKAYKLYNYNGWKVFYSLVALNDVICEEVTLHLPKDASTVTLDGGFPAVEFNDGFICDKLILVKGKAAVDHNGKMVTLPEQI